MQSHFKVITIIEVQISFFVRNLYFTIKMDLGNPKCDFLPRSRNIETLPRGELLKFKISSFYIKTFIYSQNTM